MNDSTSRLYRPEEPKINQTVRLLDSWPWAFEMAALGLAAVQFFAMIGVLVHFNGREPDTSSIITPNTIVSILSTGSKASLLSAAAECISQANWVLFADQPRRLFDFEMVSEASRGPLGSIRLLFSTSFRGGLLVRLGALITILTIAMDPFAQQLVKLQNTQISQPGGHVSQAVRYSLGTQSGGLLSYEVNTAGRIETPTPISADADFTMKAAIMFGTTATSQSIMQQTALDCPGEICEFSRLASLAVCSRCNNIDSSLEKTQDGDGILWAQLTYHIDGMARGINCTRHTLPNGLYLDNIDGKDGTGEKLVYMTTAGTTNGTKTISMGDLDTLIWSETIIKVDNATSSTSENTSWPDFEVHATECALYYCAREYDFTVRNSTRKEDSSKVISNVKRNPESWLPQGSFADEKLSVDVIASIAFDRNNSLVPRSDLQLISGGADGQNTMWNISQIAVNGISYFTQTLFSTCIDDTCSDAPDGRSGPTGFYQSHKIIGDEYKPGPAKLLWESKDLNAMFANIAMSMSNALRAGDDTERSEQGMVTRLVTIYRIEWAWIALHGVILLAMLFFFTFTIASRSPSGEKVPVWKSSNLAVLSRGYIVSDLMRDEKTSGQLDRRAKGAQAILLDTGHQPPIHNSASVLESPEQVEMIPVRNLGKANKTWDRSGPTYHQL